MQLPEGAQWYRVNGTEAGTTTIKASNTVLYGVLIGQNKTGTVTFYDNSSGTSASSYMSAIDNTTQHASGAGAVPVSLPIGARLRNGLTVVTGGTTDMLVMYQ